MLLHIGSPRYVSYDGDGVALSLYPANLPSMVWEGPSNPVWRPFRQAEHENGQLLSFGWPLCSRYRKDFAVAVQSRSWSSNHPPCDQGAIHDTSKQLPCRVYPVSFAFRVIFSSACHGVSPSEPGSHFAVRIRLMHATVRSDRQSPACDKVAELHLGFKMRGCLTLPGELHGAGCFWRAAMPAQGILQPS